MILLRLAGALTLVFSGVIAAHRINSFVSASLEQTEGMISLVRFIRVQVDCFALPIGEILALCGEKELFACGYRGSGTPKNLSVLVGNLKVSDNIAYKHFCSFASEFGRGYREEQLSECDYYLALLEEHKRSLVAALPAKKKRNSALCVTASLALAVLLL